jgi:uncharacterized membrane protein
MTIRTANFVALGLVAVAMALRLWDLDRRCIAHPEINVPGIAVPDWARYPPPRTDLASTAKSLLRDGHPPLYFVAMYPWVSVFGTGPISMRLPSVLLGAASVFLLFRLALREVGTIAALLAAALLALHGHHVFWSQMARMYAPATFLCLGSSLLLWKVFDDPRARFRVAYVATTIAALWTHVYCWNVLAAQMVWSTLRAVREKRPPIALPGQFAAIIASIPVIALMVVLYRGNEFDEGKAEFFEFGYLFWSLAAYPGRERPEPVPHVVLLVLGVVALAAGLFARPIPAVESRPAPVTEERRPSRGFLLALGALVSAGLVAATFQAFRPGSDRFFVSLAIAALPVVLGLLAPAVIAWASALAARDRGVVTSLASRVRRMSPVLLVVAVPLAMISGTVAGTFIGRGMLMVLPSFLLVAVAGLTPRGRLHLAAAPAAAILLVLHALSVSYSLRSEHAVRDYRALAAGMEARMEEADLIFIVDDYGDQPLFYHLPRRLGQFVPSDHAAALRAHPRARVWAILWDDRDPPQAWLDALAAYRQSESVTARSARAILYVP